MWADRSANSSHDSGQQNCSTALPPSGRSADNRGRAGVRRRIESTGCYHFAVVRALGGEPSVVNPLPTGPCRRKTDNLDARPKKTAKNGQNNQFEWYLMPPKMGHRTSSARSKTRQKTAKNNKNNPFDWSKIPSKMGQRTSSASGQKNSQITAQTAKNGQKWPTNSPGPRCHRRLVRRRRGRSGRFASRVEDLAVSSACRASDRAEISPPKKPGGAPLGARCSSWRPR